MRGILFSKEIAKFVGKNSHLVNKLNFIYDIYVCNGHTHTHTVNTFLWANDTGLWTEHELNI